MAYRVIRGPSLARWITVSQCSRRRASKLPRKAATARSGRSADVGTHAPPVSGCADRDHGEKEGFEQHEHEVEHANVHRG
jgi:hypothetical protein